MHRGGSLVTPSIIKSMGEITIIGSGSSGNSYALDNGKEVLLIELGKPLKNVSLELGGSMSRVVGCLVSHKHKDHAGFVEEALKRGMDVWTCKDVVDDFGKKDPLLHILPLGEKTIIGDFIIEPISVRHGCECYAFIIESPSIGKMLFITDCVSFPYRINGVNHILIEANYDNDIILDHASKGMKSHSQNENHMEIGTTIKVLREHYSPCLMNVCLIHLSAEFSDARRFVSRVKEELGFYNVYYAEEKSKEMVEEEKKKISLSKEIF